VQLASSSLLRSGIARAIPSSVLADLSDRTAVLRRVFAWDWEPAADCIAFACCSAHASLLLSCDAFLSPFFVKKTSRHRHRFMWQADLRAALSICDHHQEMHGNLGGERVASPVTSASHAPMLPFGWRPTS
jgi:hypothetical protein